MPKLQKARVSCSNRRSNPAVSPRVLAPPSPGTEAETRELVLPGIVRCFVDPEELRRLLSLMAGAELIAALIARH